MQAINGSFPSLESAHQRVSEKTQSPTKTDANDNIEKGAIGRRESSAYQITIGSNDTHSTLTYSASYQGYSLSNHTNNTSNVDGTTATVAVDEAPQQLDGARNILSFIEQRIAKEQAAGTSIEDLSLLLEQGLAGFLQGYDEAMTILGDEGSLNDTVNASVSLLRDQVIEGINELRRVYLGEDIPKAQDEPSQTVAPQTIASKTDTPSTNTLPNQVNTAQVQSLMEKIGQSQDSTIITLLESLEKIETAKEYAVEYAKTNQFSFDLTTTDGDKITIQAYRSNEAYSSSDINSKSSQQQFSFTVEGDLDEGEIEAINNLMQQVMSLSEQFYTGNIGEAYQAALAMDYDSNEIMSYALQLKQTESYQVAATYDAISPNSSTSSAAPIDLQAVFEKIGDYTQRVLESITNSNNYQHIQYAQLIDLLSQQIDEQIASPYKHHFNDTISDARQSLSL